jgi:hypothetical protein
MNSPSTTDRARAIAGRGERRRKGRVVVAGSLAGWCLDETRTGRAGVGDSRERDSAPRFIERSSNGSEIFGVRRKSLGACRIFFAFPVKKNFDRLVKYRRYPTRNDPRSENFRPPGKGCAALENDVPHFIYRRRRKPRPMRGAERKKIKKRQIFENRC